MPIEHETLLDMMVDARAAYRKAVSSIEVIHGLCDHDNVTHRLRFSVCEDCGAYFPLAVQGSPRLNMPMSMRTLNEFNAYMLQQDEDWVFLPFV